MLAQGIGVACISGVSSPLFLARAHTQSKGKLLFYNKELTKVHELTVSDAVSDTGTSCHGNIVLGVGFTLCICSHDLLESRRVVGRGGVM